MMKYDDKFNNENSWIVSEEGFQPEFLGKTEAVMNLANGYMGLRSSNEESYVNSKRGHFIAGMYNSFQDEVCELPNSADFTRVDIFIDKERISLNELNHKNYKKILNLKTLELTRTFKYITKDKKEVSFNFKRFVSYDDMHLIAFKYEIVSNADIDLVFEPFIDGQVSNSGAQHFNEKEKRIYNETTIEYVQSTTNSNIEFVIDAAHNLIGSLDCKIHMNIDRRLASLKYNVNLKANQKFELEKYVNIHTSRDLEFEKYNDFSKYREVALKEINEAKSTGYKSLFEKHCKAVEERIWDKFELELECNNEYDLLALRYAHYNLVGMMPSHDSRMGIAAKALSGEGYKGHAFWDTEVFILPFFTFTDSNAAKNLLTYRFLGLEGARKKAKENNYKGAMYPWEAAWPTDGEVTPVWGGVDVVTGKQTKIWSGFIEQHISSDIIFSLWQYYRATKDDEFMNNCGYEMIFDVANFWASRFEWDEITKLYHINDVVGPDEYKEHADDNAFTNYMAYFTLDLAVKLYNSVDKSIIKNLSSKIKLNEEALSNWIEKKDNLYIPVPNKNNVIPQDNTYLSKEIFDLTPYKNMDQVGMLFKDYNLEQVNEMQITKQADVVILMYLLEDKFNEEIKRANYEYYEPKTTHDSSLSLSTHTIIASDLHDYDLAYELFEKACRIDLGENMKTSDHGIHAASIGGIWQSSIFGFAGVRLRGEDLHVSPNLPKSWNRFKFTIEYLGQKISIECFKDHVVITPKASKEVELTVYGEKVKINSQTTFNKK